MRPGHFQPHFRLIFKPRDSPALATHNRDCLAGSGVELRRASGSELPARVWNTHLEGAFVQTQGNVIQI
eukprot:m.459973 g.459973  ORF g.459973 m.459973 type:complete len:69 (+) comp21884_c0_seq1:840-1046(+)